MDTLVKASVRALIRQATARLAGSDTARLDAELLLAHVTGQNRSWIHAHPEAPIAAHQADAFERLIQQRQNNMPLAYLTGQRDFWSIQLQVNRHTLIPRPETEHLVEQALALIPENTPWQIADLGTGSGAVAIAIAKERPDCQVMASDISDAAIQVAIENSRAQGFSNLTFVISDWLSAISQQFNLIVSNPPYIRENDPHLLSGDVQHEPRLALTAGMDGLDCIRQIIQTATLHLQKNGHLLLEHGFDQGDAVRTLFKEAGFSLVTTHADIAGHERISTGQLAHA